MKNKILDLTTTILIFNEKKIKRVVRKMYSYEKLYGQLLIIYY